MHPKKRALYFAICSFNCAIISGFASFKITEMYIITIIGIVIGLLCLIMRKIFDYINLDLADIIISFIFPIVIFIVMQIILYFS